MFDAFAKFTQDAYNKVDRKLSGVLPGGVTGDVNPTEMLINAVTKTPVVAGGRTALNVAGKAFPETVGPIADAGNNAIRALSGNQESVDPSTYSTGTRSQLADAIDTAMADAGTKPGQYVDVQYEDYGKGGDGLKNTGAYTAGAMFGTKKEDGTYEIKPGEVYDFNAAQKRGNKEYGDNMYTALGDALKRGDIAATLANIPDVIAYHTGAGGKGFEIGGSFSRPDFENTISEPQSRPTPPTSPAESDAMKAYNVAVGDTLSSIAAKHGLSIDEIARKNNIDNVNMIDVGQQLKL